ncbi:MAG: class I SAM-dependent methyltransferase [Firmicutes bacterium]|nr:class I SAM-dependent methyltransferase [Bacillota bacterium]
MTKKQQAILYEMEAYAAMNNVPVISKDSAEVLVKACKEKAPKTILEIGTAIGYSGALMLLNSDKDSNLTTIDISIPNLLEAKNNFSKLGLNDRVNIILEDCVLALQKLEGRFDFVFLDGPVAKYADCLPLIIKLCSLEAVIVADNVSVVKGRLITQKPERMKRVSDKLLEFIEAVKSNPSLKSEFYETGDGVVVARYTG